jgi:hypothetical protein
MIRLRKFAMALDTPTRIGLGGAALFTLAGLAFPLLGWWISGAIMAACAIVASWGFWPLLHRLWRNDSTEWLAREGNLIKELRKYRREFPHAHMQIHFVSPRRPVAETLKSCFQDAGWQTDISQQAYETFVLNEYPTGIEVRGINSHFVQAITQSLLNAGYSDAKPVIKPTTLEASAANWDQANQAVMLVVGYQN